jgi:hypothetical protein
MPQEGAPPRAGATLTIDGGARVTSRRTVTLTIRVDDPNFKPSEMSVSSDGVQWSAWRPFAPTTKFDVPEGDGEKTVQIKLSDAAGREMQPIRAGIVLDTTPPRADVSAPPSVPGEVVTLTSKVPDAVAMQFTEDPERWSAWEPYARFKSIPLSVGEGRKEIYVRYSDEAGNVSEPAKVSVDVKPDAAPDDKPGVQSMDLIHAARKDDVYLIRIAVQARGLSEAEVSVDGVVVQPRAEFSPTLELRIVKAGTAHRISGTFWDAAKVEYTADLAFLERELVLEAPQAPAAKSRPGIIEARFSVGPWINGLDFEAVTSLGPRRLKSGTMGVMQLSVGTSVLDPVFVELSGEYALGKDASITTFGADAGVRFYRGSMLVGDGELRAQAGVLLSSLKVDDSDFGDFDSGVGFRAGLSASVDLTPYLSLDVSLQYRSVSYDWSGTVLSGDTQAKASGVAALLGISLRF